MCIKLIIEIDKYATSMDKISRLTNSIVTYFSSSPLGSNYLVEGENSKLIIRQSIWRITYTCGPSWRFCNLRFWSCWRSSK